MLTRNRFSTFHFLVEPDLFAQFLVLGVDSAAVLESAASNLIISNFTDHEFLSKHKQTINNLPIYPTIYISDLGSNTDQHESRIVNTGTMRGLSISLMLVVVAPAIITGGKIGPKLILIFLIFFPSDIQKVSRSPGTAT